MFSLGQKQTRFKNWSESVCCEPSKWYTPHNLQELIHIVQQANQNRWTLRVVGAGHSFTPLVATGDILVSLEHFQGIDSIDRDNDYVTVWGEIGRASCRERAARCEVGGAWEHDECE